MGIKLITSLLFITQVFSFSLKVDESFSKDKREVAQASKFVQEVEALVPKLIKQSIQNTITVKFVSFKENNDITELPFDRCTETSNILYAQVSKFDRETIKISKLFLPEIMKGEEGSTSFNCGHKNYYKKAIATVLHEIAHLYDYKKIRSDIHKKNVEECFDKSEKEWKGSDKCRSVKQEQINKKTVSGLYDFYKLANWQQKIFSKQNKNLSTHRSIDPYENKNLEEHYAVNFEFFIMDSEYKCHRPSYYNFFSRIFNVKPFEDVDCKMNTKIILDDKKTEIDIAPDRVYRIDYLLASGGEGIMSGFGHSMFRLVVCAPFRKTVSEDCVKDKLYHVVLSYRANVTDIKSNAIKGVFGGYDSVLYMLSLPSVIEEYTMGELRDLMSMPIHLTREQKKNVINRVLETYWEYAGNYKFLSANCASESHDLLQSGMLDHDIKYGNVVKPYSLMEEIIDKGLSRDDYFTDKKKAIEAGLLFESDAKRLEEIKRELVGEEENDFFTYKRPTTKRRDTVTYTTIRKKKEIKDIIKEIQVSKLEEIYEGVLKENSPNELKDKLQKLSILTQGVMNTRQYDLDEEIGSYLEKIEKSEDAMGELVREWNEKRKNFRMFPEDMSYGIPLKVTQDDRASFEKKNELLEETEKGLIENVKSEFEEKIEELTQLKSLVEKIRTKSKIVSLKLYLE